MHQIDATAAIPSLAGPSTPLQRVIERKMKPLVVSYPLTPSPLGPDFLHWAIEQCGLWLNKHGGLAPMNLDSSDIYPSATLGLRALPAGLTQRWLKVQPHWLQLPLVYPSLRVGLYSPSPPAALARPSIQLGATSSKASQVPLLRPSAP